MTRRRNPMSRSVAIIAARAGDFIMFDRLRLGQEYSADRKLTALADAGLDNEAA